MSTSSWKVHWQAQVAVDALTQEDRHHLEEAIRRLGQTSPERWPADLAVPVESESPLYLLPFTADLLAFIAPDGEGVEVRQITNRRVLDTFRAAEVNGSAGG
jgi:hypothetical protein